MAPDCATPALSILDTAHPTTFFWPGSDVATSVNDARLGETLMVPSSSGDTSQVGPLRITTDIPETSASSIVEIEQTSSPVAIVHEEVDAEHSVEMDLASVDIIPDTQLDISSRETHIGSEDTSMDTQEIVVIDTYKPPPTVTDDLDACISRAIADYIAPPHSIKASHPMETEVTDPRHPPLPGPEPPLRRVILNHYPRPLPKFASQCEDYLALIASIPSDVGFPILEEGLLIDWRHQARGRACLPRAEHRLSKRPPPPKPPPPSARYPVKASFWQTWFKKDASECILNILGKFQPQCKISLDEVHHYYSQLFRSYSPPEAEVAQLMTRNQPGQARQPFDFSDIQPVEVTLALSTANYSSAPGPDGIKYSTLRSLDPEGEILANIFTQCMIASKVPAEWKHANVSLVFKQGDPQVITNWRPIALSATMGKLFSKVLASRLTTFLQQNNILSPCQKGFLPINGTAEHIWTLEAVLRSLPASGGAIFVDFKEAFSSIPHSVIWTALETAGVPAQVTALIKELYTGNTMSVNTADGSTKAFPMERGVRQGDPLSSILFLIVIDHVIKAADNAGEGIKAFGETIHSLAFADDLVIVGRTPEDLRKKMRALETAAQLLGMTINAGKCGAILKRPGAQFYLLGGAQIPPIRQSESYKYLGRRMGLKVKGGLPLSHQELETWIGCIEKSFLTPAQKIEALKVHILPKLQYLLQNDPTISHTVVVKASYIFTNAIKRILQLPRSTSLAFIRMDKRAGGLGFLGPDDFQDVTTVCQALKIANSQDTRVKAMAMEQLIDDAKQRFPKDSRSLKERIAALLNKETKRVCPARNTHGLRSLWFLTRSAVGRLNQKYRLELTFVPPNGKTGDLELKMLGKPVTTQSAISEQIRITSVMDMVAHPFQGAATTAVAADPASTQFATDGRFMSLASVSWSYRARLNLLPCNAAPETKYARRRATIGPRQSHERPEACRHCAKEAESLAHILCHCPYSIYGNGPILQRHNQVQNLIREEIRKTMPPEWTVTTDRRFPGIDSKLRPDLVFRNESKKKIYAWDVVCPFEEGLAALKIARAKKVGKYQSDLVKLRAAGWTVSFDALVVGARGTWDPANDQSLSMLSPRSLHLLKRRCVEQTMDASRKLYYRHMMGDRYGNFID